jgi:hypothetical protein
MAKYEVALYSWEESRERWVFTMDVWIDPREITKIKWETGTSSTVGDISEVTLFKAAKNTYVTVAMSRDDANYLNDRR